MRKGSNIVWSFDEKADCSHTILYIRTTIKSVDILTATIVIRPKYNYVHTHYI